MEPLGRTFRNFRVNGHYTLEEAAKGDFVPLPAVSL